ncbi:sulfite exporter TauE/SafE family protein [Methanosarcina sp. UBA5]|uniref:sulfite exporter TauE/SafE family protein n=1 Tax=Methanosarcina sp. UBA5 TaxID=1915593 RepID=UPI0025EA05A4|nr:sulfite exporter TauE/SafE family protein [Methanosarcina sp. UBA5]
MIIEAISQGILLGLSTGIFCLVTCAPVYVPFVLSEDRKLRRNILSIGEIAMGRLIAYLFFGFILGILGKLINGPWLNRTIGTAMILLSAFMLAFVVVKKWPHLGLCKMSKKYVNYPAFFGFLTGINVCPPFLLAMSAALSYASIAGSTLLFGGFFVGTSFYLILLVPLGFAAKMESIRQIGLITSVMSGIMFLALGLGYLVL